jgi:hypothetical protein
VLKTKLQKVELASPYSETRRSKCGVTVEDTPSKEKESIVAVLGIYFLNLNAEPLMMLNGFG